MQPVHDPARRDGRAAAAVDPLDLPRALAPWLAFLCALPFGLLAFGLDLGTPPLPPPVGGLASLDDETLAQLIEAMLPIERAALGLAPR